MQTKNIIRDIAKLNSLQKAVIDSSSLIYLFKLNLVQPLGHVVRLLAPTGIFNETGLAELPVVQTDCSGSNALLPDEQVLALAKAQRCAIISDDKKILRKAEEYGLDYFNSLMMLLLLYEHGILDYEQAERKLEELYAFAHYGKKIRDYGRMLFASIIPPSSGTVF